MSFAGREDFSGKFVTKPWGGEYLCFENERVAIWSLHIMAGRETSFHCHTQKSTGLLLMGGRAELELARSSYQLLPCSKLNIFPRRFHKTRALEDSILFEVETPVDKRDLVRLSDDNGRISSAYESANEPEHRELLFFDESNVGCSEEIGECQVHYRKISSFSALDSLGGGVVVFLAGGVVTNDGKLIVDVGEFLDSHVVAMYREHFVIVPNSLVFMVTPLRGPK